MNHDQNAKEYFSFLENASFSGLIKLLLMALSIKDNCIRTPSPKILKQNVETYDHEKSSTLLTIEFHLTT